VSAGGEADRADILYEIGVEEVPASYIEPALDALREHVTARLAEARLDPQIAETYATPRRFTLIVRGLLRRQSDLEQEVLGPAVGVAFDAAGAPTNAARGFARGQGVEVESLARVTTGKGEYVQARVRRPGQPAEAVVPPILLAGTRAMPFPRSMRWTASDLRFARPIRWLVALLGQDLLPLALDGIAAGRETRGIRFHRSGPFAVRDANDYLRVLAENGVGLDIGERRRRIETGLVAAGREVGGEVVADADLLAEVTNLVAWPGVIAGSFDPAFLALPRDVVTTAMRVHQRYFAVEAPAGGGGGGGVGGGGGGVGGGGASGASGGGGLLPRFLCVVNGPLGGESGLDVDRVRGGHERVLRARLADARFYWDRDVARGIEAREPELAGVVWQEGLGTLADKTARLRALALLIVEGWDPALRPVVERAAVLAKIDQVSEMVRDGKEFTGLQGRIGAEYARVAGEAPAVCAAIAEQYLPRGADDALPGTLAGSGLAVADKLDHVVGAFVAGKVPTGSEDPFAVRRAANGILRILVEADRHVSLDQLIGGALELFAPFMRERDGGRDAAAVRAELRDFFGQRMDAFLADRGIRYDLADATVHGSIDDPADVRRRAEALAEYSISPDFAPLVIGYKRVANILRGTEEGGEGKGTALPALDPKSLTEPAEAALHAAAVAAAGQIREHRAARRFPEALAELLALRAPIDRFFTETMVMVEDPAVRGRRLALLAEVRDLFTGTWDLSRVVVEGEKIR
jgi:glycyl-tRNA synthetase beta chain